MSELLLTTVWVACYRWNNTNARDHITKIIGKTRYVVLEKHAAVGWIRKRYIMPQKRLSYYDLRMDVYEPFRFNRVTDFNEGD